MHVTVELVYIVSVSYRALFVILSLFSKFRTDRSFNTEAPAYFLFLLLFCLFFCYLQLFILLVQFAITYFSIFTA